MIAATIENEGSKLMYYSPLLTDFYQLTMAMSYFQLGMHEQNACFHVTYRSNPFHGHYAVAAGLGTVIDYLENWHMSPNDLDYLSTLKNQRQEKIFSDEFLNYLQNLNFTCDIEAITEGTIVFPQIPLLRIQGPLLQCQLLETPLLNIINFQTLIATKASRVYRAANGEDVIEFGMRRAQGPDGAVSASRAAYIGGCSATSNTLAGKMYDIPVRGTHAHSFVSAFPTEKAAFTAYASVMPDNTMLLVDTYNTVTGVKHAIEVGRKLREEGGDLVGIRLDSGDLADLSIKARKLLDEAGFEKSVILASNALDEYVITDIKQQHAQINAWGVGTKLATAFDQPALDGVYKLAAIQKLGASSDSAWEFKIKLSEHEAKINNPGRLQVRRYFCNESIAMDVIYDIDFGIVDVPETVLLDKAMLPVRLDDTDAYVDLLTPVFKKGIVVQMPNTIHEMRQTAIEEVTQFYDKHGDRLYSVALDAQLYAVKQELIAKMRKNL